MPEQISLIRPPLIDNFIRIIKNLAGKGRTNYQQYLIHPLSGWSSAIPVEPIDKLLELVENAKVGKNKKLPVLYKMSIVKSVAPDQFDLSIPGNISIGFLKAMQFDRNTTLSVEALEFINILRNPFKKYSDIEFKRMNHKFSEDIETAEKTEVEKLVKIQGNKNNKTTSSMDKQSQKAMEHIKEIIKRGSEAEIKKTVILFLLKYASPSNPDRHLQIESVFNTISNKYNLSEKDIMDSTAVIIYHEILNAIKTNNLSKTVKLISKYAILFRGNPFTPNYMEVDSFEKQFFQIVEDRNLWDVL